MNIKPNPQELPYKAINNKRVLHKMPDGWNKTICGNKYYGGSYHRFLTIKEAEAEKLFPCSRCWPNAKIILEPDRII